MHPRAPWLIARLAGAALFALPGLSHAGRLELALRPTWQGEALQTDAVCYTNAAAEILSVSRLSLLLSGFALQRADGTWTGLPGVAWFDAGAKRLRATLADAPAGSYRALRFHVGPDAAQNAADGGRLAPDDPLNPLLNGLHWSWQGGYVFLALEGLFRAAGGELGGWSYHLARDPNRTAVTLEHPLDLRGGERLSLEFNLATLLGLPSAPSFRRDGTSTHSREGDPIAAALVRNLPEAFSVRGLTRAGPDEPATAPASADLPARWTPHPFTLPAIFPLPALPRDNPLITGRVALGARLFHETALSRDGTLSCASCHQQAAGFADPRRVSVGVDGRTGTRQAMPLQNLAWKRSFLWDGRAATLRAQAAVPIETHNEMDEQMTNVCAKLARLPGYPAQFAAAFAGPEITPARIGLALEAFQLTLTSYDARFDQAVRGGPALSEEEKRGFLLFMTEFDPRRGLRGADCFHCHGVPLFSDQQFHNNGLDVDPPDRGREAITGRPADRGKFATPSLRNVARTAPYMHDGRFATLEEVVAHYSEGVKMSPTLDPNLAKHPAGGLHLTEEERRTLVAFLKCL